jgi:hypothetical protein
MQPRRRNVSDENNEIEPHTAREWAEHLLRLGLVEDATGKGRGPEISGTWVPTQEESK